MFLTLKNSYLGEGYPVALQNILFSCLSTPSSPPGPAVITGGTENRSIQKWDKISSDTTTHSSLLP